MESQHNKVLLKDSSNRSELAVTKKVAEATIQEIQLQIAHIATLLGLSDKNLPDADGYKFLIGYIKSKWSHTDLYEMRDAFTSAAENKFVDLNLYDKRLSIDYMKTVILEYRKFKLRQTKATNNIHEGMTNHKRAEGIIGMIAKQNPELYEKLKNIGKEKPPPQPEQNQTTHQIKGVFKDYENEYKKLWDDQCLENNGGFVRYNQKMYNFSEYCNHRFNEDYPEVKENNDQNKEDNENDPEDILP